MGQTKQAVLLADLGFGDAGKGSITDFLTRTLTSPTIVRYNGGPQAAHNVITPEGQHHTFAHFGSGMFLPWTRTLLSRFMLVNPLNMLKEARHLSALGVTDVLQRTLLDERALVITPFQRALNRLRELARAEGRHGSCGEGVGECMADALAYGRDTLLQAGDLQDRVTMVRKLRWLRDAKRNELAELIAYLPATEQVQQECALLTDPQCLEDCLEVYLFFAQSVQIVDDAMVRTLFAGSGSVIFEGAQGVLLDENYGFAPYTTWSTTTLANAETLLHENEYSGEVSRLGLVRTYATRHGAGPFPTEDPSLADVLPEPHNAWNDWQRTFRVGHFDLVMARYALDLVGNLDGLVVTHLDRVDALPTWKFCHAYSTRTQYADTEHYFEHEGNILTKVRRPGDLAHQEELTRRLWECQPEYLAYPQSNWKSYLEILIEQLGVPVVITSHGPSATEKAWR